MYVCIYVCMYCNTFMYVCLYVGATGQALWNTVHNISSMWYLEWNFEPISFWYDLT